MKATFNKKPIIVMLLLVAVLILVLVNLAIGAVRIPPGDIAVILAGKTAGNASAGTAADASADAAAISDILLKEAQIILFVRLPRILSALLAGSALAVSGTILQNILGNPVVSPGIIGINSGSGFFYLLAAAFMPASFFIKPVFAFAGALAAGLLVYFIGYKTGASKLTIVLSGIAVTSLLTAFSDTLITIFPNTQFNRTAFLIGGLGGASMQNVKFAYIYILAGMLLAMAFSYDLNVLSLGDETAGSLGLKVKKIRFLYIAVASLLAAGAVSIAGLIGFVGLIVPHITRLIMGNDNRWLIPSSAIMGAAVLLFCDLLARTLFTPFELPVGIILSFAGAPFFIYLLLKHRRRLSL